MLLNRNWFLISHNPSNICLIKPSETIANRSSKLIPEHTKVNTMLDSFVSTLIFFMNMDMACTWDSKLIPPDLRRKMRNERPHKPPHSSESKCPFYIYATQASHWAKNSAEGAHGYPKDDIHKQKKAHWFSTITNIQYSSWVVKTNYYTLANNGDESRRSKEHLYKTRSRDNYCVELSSEGNDENPFTTES